VSTSTAASSVTGTASSRWTRSATNRGPSSRLPARRQFVAREQGSGREDAGRRRRADPLPLLREHAIRMLSWISTAEPGEGKGDRSSHQGRRGRHGTGADARRADIASPTADHGRSATSAVRTPPRSSTPAAWWPARVRRPAHALRRPVFWIPRSRRPACTCHPQPGGRNCGFTLAPLPAQQDQYLVRNCSAG